MSKREIATNPDTDIEAPRSKRRKDVLREEAIDDIDPNDPGASSDQDNDDAGEFDASYEPKLSPEEVRDEGLKVLQVLKDAVNKEGRSISLDFLRLPSKRQFPDYYQVIKKPIALEDIQKQLENLEYPSLEALREEFETCFKNAKRYNVRESVIWKDAKSLQKLANKELDKLTRKDVDDDASDKEGKKRERGVNVNRLMKNRLQKLASMTDDSNRQLASVFMDLPSKKKWPVYYKIIKKPICIEDIFKRIKRKEYSTIADFMNDVDLVFANAMQFNEEHSLIWEDAATLKEYFHQIMSDLPAKYRSGNDPGNVVLSEQVPNPNPKIRLKLPTQHPVTQANAESDEAQNTSSASVRLRVPPLNSTNVNTKSESSTIANNVADVEIAATPSKPKKSQPSGQSTTIQPPSIPQTPQLSATSAPAPTPVQPAKSPTPVIAAPTPKPAVTIPSQPLQNTTPSTPASQVLSQQLQTNSINPTAHSQYNPSSHMTPQNFYNITTFQPSRTSTRGSSTPAPTSTPTIPAAPATRSSAPSPAPPVSAAGLYSMYLDLCPPQSPRSRLVQLDSRAGVRVWVLRIPTPKIINSEDGVKVILREVKLVPREDDGDGSEDEVGKVEPAPIPKKRGRGRPRKVQQFSQQEVETAPSEDKEKDKDKEKKGKSNWKIAAASDVIVQLDGKPIIASNLPISSPLSKNTTEPPLLDQSMQKSEEAKSAQKDTVEWILTLSSGQHTLEVSRKGNTVSWQVYLVVP